MTEKFDIVVIGGGPGGARAANRCAQKGANVALIEKESLGGICLNRGCIPLKALLASAHQLLAAKNAEKMGIETESVKPNWQTIQQRKNNLVDKLRKGMTASMKAGKAKLIQGRAIVTEPNKIQVKTDEGQINLEAEKIILATGSAPLQLPQIPFDGQTVISSNEALSLPDLPPSLIIIGGGVIGCEMACLYAAMGTQVTVIEALEQLIPMEDQWVGRLLKREFEKLGIKVITKQKGSSLLKNNNKAKLQLDNGQQIEAQKVLVAVGRKGVCDKETIQNLNLETNGSEIKVNEKLQTSAPNVFALGDVIGTTYLAHGATYEAEIAAVNATGGNKTITDYSIIPRTVYTFPEIASVGKTMNDCKAEEIDISVGKAFFRANGRAVAQDEIVGEVRALRNKTDDKIIGITMVGQIVTELASLATTIIQNGKVTNISFPHPTFSETLQEAVENTRLK